MILQKRTSLILSSLRTGTKYSCERFNQRRYSSSSCFNLFSILLTFSFSFLFFSFLFSFPFLSFPFLSFPFLSFQHASSVLRFYKGSLKKALLHVYPDIGLKAEHFSSPLSMILFLICLLICWWLDLFLIFFLFFFLFVESHSFS